RIEGDGAVGVEIVARPHRRVEVRRRIADAPDGEVLRLVIGADAPDRAAAGLPRFAAALPGLRAGLARRRHREAGPDDLAGLGAARLDEVARAIVGAAGAEDDVALEGERRAGVILDIRLARRRFLEDRLAGADIGGDQAPVEIGRAHV